MGKHCAAIGCTNTNKKLKTKQLKEGVTFHAFPHKNPTILKEWVHRLRRKGFNPTEYSFLCSEHFTEDDFEYQPFTGMRMIKKGAVPSKFVFNAVCKERKRTSYEFGALWISRFTPKKMIFSSRASVRVPARDDTPLQKSVSTQTLMSLEDVATLIKSEQDETEKSKRLEDELRQNFFSMNLLTSSQLKDLTGCDLECFQGLYRFFKLDECLKHKTKKFSLSKTDQFFLTLLRLRQNLTFRLLSILFKIELCSVSLIFNRCISIIYTKAKAVDIWPSVQQIRAYMPPLFFQSFPACRVIIDATEFYIHKPSNPSQQQASFSTYKNYNTLRGLIGISPSGAISFISDLWLGSISDKELTIRSGLINKLESGDTVLADRGFTSLEPEFIKKDITLITPTFLKDKIQFPVGERSNNKNISSHRVHVERAIAGIKCIRILDGVIPLAIKNIDQIYYVCAFLCNFTNTPLISSETMLKV